MLSSGLGSQGRVLGSRCSARVRLGRFMAETSPRRRGSSPTWQWRGARKGGGCVPPSTRPAGKPWGRVGIGRIVRRFHPWEATARRAGEDQHAL